MTTADKVFQKVLAVSALFFVLLIVISFVGFSYSAFTRPPVEEELIPGKNGLILGEYDER